MPNKALLLALIVADAASHIRWSYDHKSPRNQLVENASEVYRTYAAITRMPDVLGAGTQAGARSCVVAEPLLTTATAMVFSEERASGLWRACWFLISSQLQVRDDIDVGTRSPGSTTPEDADLTVYVTALIDGMFSATPDVKAPTVSGVRAG
ncbi:hypothetical protein [Gordonia sp. NPDC003376]